MAHPKRDNEKFVYLSFIREGDSFKVVDQDGRRVSGLIKADMHYENGELAKVSMTFLDAAVDPEADPRHIGRPRNAN